MFFELLDSLTPEQRQQLAAVGIPSPRVSEWKKGKYLPGRPHTAAIAAVTGADFDKLNRELAELEFERDAAKNPAATKLGKQLLSKIRML